MLVEYHKKAILTFENSFHFYFKNYARKFKSLYGFLRAKIGNFSKIEDYLPDKGTYIYDSPPGPPPPLKSYIIYARPLSLFS